MGIRGLFSFIKSKQIYDIIDLVDVAKTGRIELIVQALGVRNYIREIVISKTRRHYRNSFLLERFSEYDVINQIYYDFHMSFKAVGIDLVWVFDALQLLDEVIHESASSSSEDEDAEAAIDLTRIQDVEVDIDANFIWQEIIMEQLKKAGAEIIHINPGQEFDSMARICLDRGSYAIFANCHADFLMFEGCKVLFAQLFADHYGGDPLKAPFIDLNSPDRVFKEPVSFHCQIVHLALVMRELNLTSYDQLIAISILKGNNFVSDECRTLTYRIGLTKHEDQDPFIVWVSNYVKRNNITTSNLGNIIDLRSYVREHPSLIDKIAKSKLFYNLQGDAINIRNPVINDDDLTIFVTNGVYNGTMARRAYYMHRGSYTELAIYEKLPSQCVSINELMLKIREQIYPFLVDRRFSFVRESWLRVKYIKLVKVIHSDIKTHQIIDIVDGLRIFEEIWSHMEPGNLNYVERFGVEKAFLLYILRYLFKITKDINLCLSEQEFKSVFVTVFHHHAVVNNIQLNAIITRDSFMRMKIEPSDRCITIGTWLEQIYLHATFFCGGALNLMKHFPVSLGIMNGSALFAFYETMDSGEGRTNHVSPELLITLVDVVDDVMNMFEEYYQVVTKS